jgi:arsenate reductase
VYTMYGIPNCNTVKKARDFMDGKKKKYDFVDFKKVPPTLDNLKKWHAVFGDDILNKKGTTFRQNKEALDGLTGQKLFKALIEFPSAIKRPVLEKNGEPVRLGFSEEDYQKV